MLQYRHSSPPWRFCSASDLCTGVPAWRKSCSCFCWSLYGFLRWLGPGSLSLLLVQVGLTLTGLIVAVKFSRSGIRQVDLAAAQPSGGDLRVHRRRPYRIDSFAGCHRDLHRDRSSRRLPRHQRTGTQVGGTDGAGAGTAQHRSPGDPGSNPLAGAVLRRAVSRPGVGGPQRPGVALPGGLRRSACRPASSER